jgi:hypothetical protein
MTRIWWRFQDTSSAQGLLGRYQPITSGAARAGDRFDFRFTSLTYNHLIAADQHFATYTAVAEEKRQIDQVLETVPQLFAQWLRAPL